MMLAQIHDCRRANVCTSLLGTRHAILVDHKCGTVAIVFGVLIVGLN